MKRISWLTILPLTLLGAGCHKNDASVTSTPLPDTNTNAQTTSTGQPPPGPPPAPPPAPNTSVASGDVADLTRQLRRWMMHNQRVPKDFADFAATAGFPIPPPPAGKKYAIKSSNVSVVLVDQ